MTDNLIIVDKVNYIYSAGTAYEKQALKDVSFTIKRGEFIGIIGHTGSGKSTLVQLLNGLEKATSGNIYYNGMDIYDKDFDMKGLKSKVGLVFQYPEHQLFETTVLEDVKYGPRNQGLDKLDVDMRAFEALKSVGFKEELFDASPFELSGGQKRRAAIAGVLAMKPEVLVLDEPTAGLDPKGRDEILGLLAQLHKDSGITVVLVSHSMEDVADYADRILAMDDGQIAYDGTPREVFSHYVEIEKMGLRAPSVTYIMHGLKQRGFDVDTSAIRVNEAKEQILKFLRNK